jgi:hypothetical protein
MEEVERCLEQPPKRYDHMDVGGRAASATYRDVGR